MSRLRAGAFMPTGLEVTECDIHCIKHANEHVVERLEFTGRGSVPLILFPQFLKHSFKTRAKLSVLPEKISVMGCYFSAAKEILKRFVREPSAPISAEACSCE